MAAAIFVAQQYFEAGLTPASAAGGEERGQGWRAHAMGAVEEANGAEAPLQQPGHRGVELVLQGLLQPLGEGGFEESHRGGGIPLVDRLPSNGLAQAGGLGIER